MLVQEALFAEVDEAQNAGETECGVSENTERNVKRKGDARGRRRGKPVRRREFRKKKKGHNERKNERADRTLTMEKFEAEVGKREKPAEKRHGAGEIVIGNSVQATSAFKKGEIVDDETTREKQRAETARPFAASYKKADVAGEAAQVRRKCK